jgi:hypothetical protein
MPISSREILAMSTKAQTLHGNYFINLEQDSQGWHVTAINHGINGWRLLPPGFSYPDQATAEQYAKAAIDVQHSARRRVKRK